MSNCSALLCFKDPCECGTTLDTLNNSQDHSKSIHDTQKRPESRYQEAAPRSQRSEIEGLSSMRCGILFIQFCVPDVRQLSGRGLFR